MISSVLPGLRPFCSCNCLLASCRSNNVHQSHAGRQRYYTRYPAERQIIPQYEHYNQGRNIYKITYHGSRIHLGLFVIRSATIFTDVTLPDEDVFQISYEASYCQACYSPYNIIQLIFSFCSVTLLHNYTSFNENVKYAPKKQVNTIIPQIN